MSDAATHSEPKVREQSHPTPQHLPLVNLIQYKGITFEFGLDVATDEDENNSGSELEYHSSSIDEWFNDSDEGGESEGLIGQGDDKAEEIPPPTHVTLKAGIPSHEGDPLTIEGRKRLRERIGEEKIKVATDSVKTVSIESLYENGCTCDTVFEDLSEEAKALELEAVVLKHLHIRVNPDRSCPLLSYRQCLTESKLALKAKTFIVLNEPGSCYPTTFIMSTRLNDDEASCSGTFDEMDRADNESVHVGFVDQGRGPTDRKADSVVPHPVFMHQWSEVARASAPRSVSLVNVCVDGGGKHSISDKSTTRLINKKATQQHIDERIQKYPGKTAERHRENGAPTKYSFITLKKFAESVEGKKLAEYKDLE